MSDQDSAANTSQQPQPSSQPVPVLIDGDVDVVQFARAIAGSGLQLRHNLATGELHIARARQCAG